MKLTDHLPALREKFARFSDDTRILYKRTLHLREMPDGRCQVIRYISKEDYERPDYKEKYQNGALVIAEGKTWKELEA